MHPLLAEEAVIRLGCFVGIFLLVAVAEASWPRRPRSLSRRLRWGNNLAVVVLDTVALRLLFPLLAVGLALVAEEKGWGLFHALDVPGWVAFIASFLVLDLVIYLQHVMFHAVPAFWRLHAMHHADPEIDVSTGVRFHPGEIFLSMVLKLAVVAALGPPAVAVLVFEIALNATSMFNHANLALPPSVDRIVRWFLVTPDMHRVHHSVIKEETNSNFGFNFPWWDRLLGTYRAQPAAGHDGMTIGLRVFRAPRDQWLDHMLIQPFRNQQD